MLLIGSMQAVNLTSVGNKAGMLRNERAAQIVERQAAKKAVMTRIAPKHRAIADVQTYNVVVDRIYVDNYSWDDSYNYLITLSGVDSNTGDSIWMALDCYPTTKPWAATYTTDDGSLSTWSGLNNSTSGTSEWLLDDGETISQFSFTLDSPEYYSVSGTLYGDEGGIYNLSGSNIFYPDPQSYELTGIKWQEDSMSGEEGEQIFARLTTIDNTYFQFVINLGIGQSAMALGEEYTIDDCDLEYTAGYRNHSLIYPAEISLTKYQTTTGKDSIILHFVADNDDTYDVTYVTPTLPETFTEVDMIANTAKLYDYTATDGVFQFLGVSEDGEWNLSVAVYSNHLAGTYTASEVCEPFTYIGMSDLTVDLTLDYGRIENIQVTAGTEAGDYICRADLYCYNGNLYHVTINHVRPAVQETVNFNANNLKIYPDSEFGNVAYAHNDTYDFGMALPEIKSAYAAGELNANAQIRATGEDLEVYETNAFQLSYDQNQVPTLTGSFLTTDGTLYNCNFTYVKPTATRQETLTVATANGELREMGDGFLAQGYNADSTKFIAVYVTSEQVPGTYAINDLSVFDTYLQEDADSYWNSVYFDPEDAQLSVTVEQNGEWDIAHITGTMLFLSQQDETDIPMYTLDMTVRIKRGLYMDEEDNDFVEVYTTDEITMVDHSATEGWILVQGKNADDKSFAIVFFTEEADSQITLPEGVYTFADTQANGTVFQSPGMDASGMSAQASFAATTNVLGFIIGNPWFMERGQVTVSNVEGVLTIAIQAKNSYNRNILIGVNCDAPEALPDGLNTISSECQTAEKVIRNGQLIIRRNGREYNAQGAMQHSCN